MFYLLPLLSLPIYILFVTCAKKPPEQNEHFNTKSATFEVKEKTQTREPISVNIKEKNNLSADENRQKWVTNVVERRCRDISDEYTNQLKYYKVPGLPQKTSEQNLAKNRYSDVWCLDDTRVVLQKKKNDYIHASWVIVPDKSTKYICAQGPLADTQEEFWHMIFQEKTKFVIMLCNIMESGCNKCVMYWPEKKGESVTHGEYKITNVEIKPDPIEGCRWSLLDILFEGKTFQVYHVFVPWWPDQLAPVDPAPMVNLYKWVKSLNEKNVPILVHCSAGVGRTATFVGIDYANIRISDNYQVQLLDIIKEMRTQRYQSIQSHVQYLYLHICLIEYFMQEGLIVKEGRIKEFVEEYQRHAKRKLNRKEEKDKKDAEKDLKNGSAQ